MYEKGNALSFFSHMWQPKISNPEHASRLASLEEKINSKHQIVRDQEAQAGKLTRDTVIKAKAVGELLLKVKALLGGQYTLWVENRFDGSLSTAKGYRRLARREVWEKVEKLLKSEDGCTLRQALKLAVKNPKADTPRKEMLQKKLAGQFSKIIRSFPEEALARLTSDPLFIKLIEELARERSNANEAAIQSQIIAA